MAFKLEDSLWKVVHRYDTYFTSTNNKAAVLIAYDTFAVGAALLQFANLDAIAPAGCGWPRPVFFALVAGVTLSSLWSLFHVLAVIMPYTASNRKAAGYHSIVFWDDVAEHQSADDYVQQVKTYNEQQMQEDLARQAHVLASGLRQKFARFQRAIWVLAWVQLWLVGLFIGFVLWRRF
jgi:hypothetical protein